MATEQQSRILRRETETIVSWTDDRVEMLKKLWAEGLSASQIAAKLGGVSRNAVIGKVHRLKLSGRAKSPKSAAPKTKRTAAPRSAASGATGGRGGGGYGAGGRTGGSMTHAIGATALKQDHQLAPLSAPVQRPMEDVVVPIPKRLPLTELNEHTCKWPYGDPLAGEFYFCGHNSDEKSPYCKYHGKLAFQQNDRKRQR